jgi:hypothetical protein
MTTKSTKNPAAVALGKLGAGKPKNYSAEELKRRTARLKAARKSILGIALAASVALTGNLKADELGRFIAEIKTDQALAGSDAETVRLQHDAEQLKEMRQLQAEVDADDAATRTYYKKFADAEAAKWQNPKQRRPDTVIVSKGASVSAGYDNTGYGYVNGNRSGDVTEIYHNNQ